MKYIKYSTITIIALVGCYTLLMSVIYLIPNSLIENNVEFSVKNLVLEGDYPELLFGNSTQFDNYTDTLMLNHCISNVSGNMFQKGLSIRGYARYWHGYQVFLRPALVVFDDVQIKYINLFIFYFLLFYLVILLNREMNWIGVFSLILPMIMCHFYVVPMSKQFFSVFLMVLLASIYILRVHRKIKSDMFPLLFFLITGSLTSFFDLLTTPVLTLGIPLSILYFLKRDQFSNSLSRGLWFVIKNSLSWVWGYGLSWFLKWFIAGIVLGKNVIADGFQTVLFRISGECQEVQVTFYSAIRENIYRMMYTYHVDPLSIQPSGSVKYIPLVIILLVLIVFVVLMIGYKRKFRIEKNAVPLLLIAIYPYIWYVVLANHSTIHAFTYRDQIVTGFALLLFMGTFVRPKFPVFVSTP